MNGLRVSSNRNIFWIRRIPILIAGLILTISSTVPAFCLPKARTLDECRLDIWSERVGPPASTISSFALTADGFISLATSAGLVRFDGSAFTTFDSHNTPGLTSDLIRCLTVRKDGTLWLGTEWSGFGPFSGGKFTPLWPATRHWHRVDALKETLDRTMLVSVVDDGNSSGVFRVVGDHVMTPRSPGIIRALATAGTEVIAGSIVEGAAVVRPDGRLSQFGPRGVFAGKTVTSIVQGADGTLWFGTLRDGLIHVQHGNATIYTERDGLTSNHVNCLFEDREGCLWIGSNNGIVRWDGVRFTSFGKADGLYGSNVSSIFEDHEGNLWVAAGFGLNRFAPTKLVPYGLTRNSVVATVYGISGAPNCAVWCAADLGLWKLTPSGSVYCEMPDGLPREYADGVAVAEDGSLYLWFRMPDGSFSVYNMPAPETNTGPFAAWHHPVANPQAIVDPSTNAPPRSTVHVAFPASRGTSTSIVGGRTPAHIDINVAVPDHEGITFFAGGSMTRVEHGKVVSRVKLFNGYEFSAVKGPTGDYWIGASMGLVHVQHGNATVCDDGLPNNTHVLAVDATDPTCLWLATDKGLARFQGGKSTLYTTAAGLPDDNLFQIRSDGLGNLWVGCQRCLFTVKVDELAAYDKDKRHHIKSTSYTTADGVRSYFNLFSSARTADGRLWFTGDNGVTMVDPEHVAVNDFSPPVTIESASMDRTTLDASKPTNVEPGDGRLHVSFAALSFAAPELVRFRYRLDGFDNAWVETNRRTAEYTNLPPGSYRFVVTACNNDGVWNRTGASIAFRLEPHYYETFWFKALMSIAMLAAIGLAFAWRMRQVVKHNSELESLVTERTAELRLSNDQLQAAQEEMTAQNQELEAARDYLEQRVADRTRELENAYDRTIEGWSFVMDLRDKETEGHSRRVTDVTVLMAEALGLSGEDIDNVRRGALLHDIGKMGIPDSVLLKPGPLTDDEWKVMRMHPVYAYEILSQIDYLKAAVNIPWCHHEKWDGTGYPRGLKGEDIPLAARMFSIVDVWDALRSDRPYRKGWSEEKVFDHLQSLAGTHFEPELVELFFQVMSKHEDVRPGDLPAELPEAKAA